MASTVGCHVCVVGSAGLRNCSQCHKLWCRACTARYKPPPPDSYAPSTCPVCYNAQKALQEKLASRGLVQCKRCELVVDKEQLGPEDKMCVACWRLEWMCY
jgi:hypothetical protein